MVLHGNSACSVLAVTIREWFQSHIGRLPSNDEFDMLILDGTLKWKALCQDPKFRTLAKFYDLETVFQGVKRLRIDKSGLYVGFFNPKGVHYVDGALTVDEIWEKLYSVYPKVYIVGYNCHFFVLVADKDVFYIDDTFGSRLKKSSSKTYILKFDENTLLKSTSREFGEKLTGEKRTSGENCKTYFQKFLASLKEEMLGHKEPSKIVQILQVDFYALL